MNLKTLLKNLLGLEFYVSKLDQFLADFDQSHPKLSASQNKEIKKYERIYRLRNQGETQQEKTTLWDKF